MSVYLVSAELNILPFVLTYKRIMLSMHSNRRSLQVVCLKRRTILKVKKPNTVKISTVRLVLFGTNYTVDASQYFSIEFNQQSPCDSSFQFHILTPLVRLEFALQNKSKRHQVRKNVHAITTFKEKQPNLQKTDHIEYRKL